MSTNEIPRISPSQSETYSLVLSIAAGFRSLRNFCQFSPNEKLTSSGANADLPLLTLPSRCADRSGNQVGRASLHPIVGAPNQALVPVAVVYQPRLLHRR